MIQTKLRVGAPAAQPQVDPQIAVPVALPSLDEIRQLAAILHKKGRPYTAEHWGWPVVYDPGTDEPPIDSQLTFTPASFWIGIWPLWYVSLTWEFGPAQEPSLLVGDENLV